MQVLVRILVRIQALEHILVRIQALGLLVGMILLEMLVGMLEGMQTCFLVRILLVAHHSSICQHNLSMQMLIRPRKATRLTVPVVFSSTTPFCVVLFFVFLD